MNKLNKRLNDDTIRTLTDYSGKIDFISNDYLSLSTYQFPTEKFEGSTGSRLISGNRKRIVDIEKELARSFDYADALCFNSGYDANLGVFSSIPQKGDVVLYDEHIHASVRDGIRLSWAESFSFNHNSVEDLTRHLVRCSGKPVYIAIEGIYSMHGDIPPLKEIVEVAEKHNAKIIIDEAHSAGILGENGKGLTDLFGVKVYLKLVTFGKAYGAHGACVLTDNETINYLINFSRPFIYSTALPMESYNRMLSVVLLDTSEQRSKLQYNLAVFREATHGMEIDSAPLSPIQIIRGPIEKLRKLSSNILENNIAVKPIFPPTVKSGEECIRLCIHAHNSNEEILLLSDLLLK